MGLRFGRAFRALGVVGAAFAAAPASAGLPLHLPGRHAAPKIVIPTEGPWFVHAGALQDIYANTGKKPLAIQAYVCVKAPPGTAPRVDMVLQGRAPIEVLGCGSVYLLLAPGDRIALSDPGPADVTGTYKLDLQSPLK